MKCLIWKLVYKIICKWEKTAAKNCLTEQVNECIQIENRMVHYRATMIEKGVW